MSQITNIEWCDSTFNPWIGCTRVSPACDHCYAAVSTPARTNAIEWGAGKQRHRTSPANWKLPMRWNARPFAGCNECGRRGEPVKGQTGYLCKSCGHINLSPARRRVFCASLADVFDNEVDPQWRIDLLELIAKTPNLDWLLLTKRIGNAERLIDEALDVMSNGLTRWRDAPWPNVWIGATICNQAEADRDVPKLQDVPASVRFLSIEPMLGPIALTRIMRRDGDWTYCDNALTGFRAHKCGGHTYSDSAVSWVIAGGESGHGARQMRPEWVRSLREQCAGACVPFLFKQWGEWTTSDQLLPRPTSPDEQSGRMFQFGKKQTGRLLDGVLHDGFPVAR